MKLTLKIWRQQGPNTPGKFEDYSVDGISPDMSFLEMLDILNIRLVREGQPAIEFDHDCREGICGSAEALDSGTNVRMDRAISSA